MPHLRPNRQDHDVRRVGLPGVGEHLERAVLGLPEPGDAIAELEVHAVLDEVALDEP